MADGSSNTVAAVALLAWIAISVLKPVLKALRERGTASATAHGQRLPSQLSDDGEAIADEFDERLAPEPTVRDRMAREASDMCPRATFRDRMACEASIRLDEERQFPGRDVHNTTSAERGPDAGILREALTLREVLRPRPRSASRRGFPGRL